MSQGDCLLPLDDRLGCPSRYEICALTQDSNGEEIQGSNGLLNAYSLPLFTGTGAWAQQDAGTACQNDLQALPNEDQFGMDVIPKSQYAQPQPEPWTPFARSTSASRQTAMESPYGHGTLRAHSVPTDYPCYSQSTVLSVQSELSSDFALNNHMGGAPNQVQTYTQAASTPAYDEKFLHPLPPNQPWNDRFFNSTTADTRSSQTPSIASRTSGGGGIRPRRPARPTTEPRRGPYLCKTCDKRFDTPGDRNHHEITHGERTFPCPECSKSFLWQKDLSRHMTKHTKARDFLCIVCGRSFTRRDNCRRHQEKRHPNLS